MAAAPPEPLASTAASDAAHPVPAALDRCWSALRPELLARVLRLLPLDDRAACECVCPPWRAVARDAALWESLSFAALRRPITAAALRALTARAGTRLRRLDVTATACAALHVEDVAACLYTCNEYGFAFLPLNTLPPGENLEELVMITPGVAVGQRGAAGVTLSCHHRGCLTCEHVLVAALPRLRLWSTALELAHMSPLPGPPTDVLGPFVYGIENLTRVLATFPPGEKHVRVNPNKAFPPVGPLLPPGVPRCPEGCQGTPCDVRVCHLRGVWMPPLAEALARDETVTVLDLSINWDVDNQPNLGLAATQPIADMLRANHTLQKLHMQGHALGNQGAAIIAQGLAENRTLTELHLQYIGPDLALTAARR
jgi:hypothetical protein